MVRESLSQERNRLFESLEAACVGYLGAALSEKGAATLLVSGGSTPASLYERLADSDLEWNRIQIALVDERWVEPDHPASNEALIRSTLLTGRAETAPFVGMKNPARSAADGWPATEARYQVLTRPFTLAILGMGGDAHTASLFPYAEGLTEALDPENPHLTAPILARQSEVTGPNTERLSLTLAGLLHAEHLILLLTGEEKLAVYRAALAGVDIAEMPVRAVLHQSKVPVELYWAP